jgi:Gram-negative bacterial TonB protein C-terminal
VPEACRVERITFRGIGDFHELSSKLQVQRGDLLTDDLMRKTGETVREFGEHLRIQVNPGPGDNPANIIIYDPAGVFPQRIKLEAEVLASFLIERVTPVPELEAGSVQLSVIVGRDGTVLDARPVKGAGEVFPAAIEAVKRWKYRPILLNGLPVEVQSTVELQLALEL